MRIEYQVAFWIGALAFLGLFLWLFSGVLLPFAAAIAIGYLLDPIADRLQRLGINRLGATLILLALFLLFVALALILLAPILVRQLANFIQAVPDYAVRLQSLVSTESEKLAQGYGGVIAEKLGIGGGNPVDIKNYVNDIVSQGGQWLLGVAKSLWSQGAALISLVSLIVITPVVAFYMLLDWDKMIATVDRLVPLRHRDTVRGLAREIDRAMAGFLRGQSLVCLFLGVWYGLGLSLIGLNFGFLIGAAAGVLSFIPYVGSLTALVLSATVALVQGWPEWHLLAFALGVVFSGQFLEGNILSPKLVGESVGLHPVWVMFALLGFGSLFGFTGLIVAVPMAAALGVILRFAVRRYLASPLYSGASLALASDPGRDMRGVG